MSAPGVTVATFSPTAKLTTPSFRSTPMLAEVPFQRSACVALLSRW